MKEPITIKDVFHFPWMRDHIGYAGTLRNEKKFNLDDDVYIDFKSYLVRGRIIGVEKIPNENPEYIYKVWIPENIVKKIDPKIGCGMYESLTCQYIFSSKEEAMQSSMKRLETDYKLAKEQIERYFNERNNI